MLNPFINLIGAVIDLYILVLIVWTVMSILISFDVINRYNRLVSQVFSILSQLVEPALEPIRRALRKVFPRLYSVDLSPLVLLLLLSFIKDALYSWFYSA